MKDTARLSIRGYLCVLTGSVQMTLLALTGIDAFRL